MSRRSHLPLVRIAALIAMIAGVATAVPAAATDRVVVVQPGDTLSEIALANGVSVAQLRGLNGIADPNRIFAGQRLRLTGTPSAVPATTAATAAPQAATHVVAAGDTWPASPVATARPSPPSRRPMGSPTRRSCASGSASPSPAPRPRHPGTCRGEAGSRSCGARGPRRRGGRAPDRHRPSLRLDHRRHRESQRACQRVVHSGRTAARHPWHGAPATTQAGRMPTSMATLVAALGAIGAIISTEAKARGVPVAFALAVAWQESGWQPGVVSRAGAVGVMQLTPPTADWVASTMLGRRIELYDARSNIQAGITCCVTTSTATTVTVPWSSPRTTRGQTAADRHGVYPVTRPYIASISTLEKLFANWAAPASPCVNGTELGEPPAAALVGAHRHQVDPHPVADDSRLRHIAPQRGTRDGVPADGRCSPQAPARPVRRTLTSTATTTRPGSSAMRSISPSRQRHRRAGSSSLARRASSAAASSARSPSAWRGSGTGFAPRWEASGGDGHSSGSSSSSVKIAASRRLSSGLLAGEPQPKRCE